MTPTTLFDLGRGAFEAREARAVTLTGPLGAGKRTLARALTRQLRDAGVRTLATKVRAAGGRRSFSVMAAALRGLVEGPLTRTSVAALVQGARLPSHVASPVEDTLVAWLTGPDRRAVLDGPLRSCLLWLFDGWLTQGPLALVLSEMQDADEATLRLVDDLASGILDGALLVAITARPRLWDAHPEVFARATRLTLEPPPQPPFEIDERLAAIAALPEQSRDALSLGVLLGRPFPDELVFSTRRIQPGWQEPLIEGRLIAAAGRPGTWDVARDELRELVLDAIPLHQLPAQHAAVAKWLVATERADPEEIAEHFAAARQSTASAEYYTRAALERDACGDYSGALRTSERALELVPQHDFALLEVATRALAWIGRADEAERLWNALDRRARTAQERTRAKMFLAIVARQLGRVRLAAATSRSLHEEALAAGDVMAAAEAIYRLVDVAWCYPRTLDAANASLETFRARYEHTPGLRRTLLLSSAAKIAWGTGRLDRARDLFSESAAARAADGDEEGAAWPRSGAFTLGCLLGDYARAIEPMLELARVQRRVALAGWRITAAWAAEAAVHLGDLARAHQILTGLTAGRPSLQERDAIVLASARYAIAVGDGMAALDVLAGLDVGERDYLDAQACAVRADAHRLLGQHDTALRTSKRALVLRNDLGWLPENDAEVFRSRYEALRAAGETNEARACAVRGARAVQERASRIEDAAWRASFLESVPTHRMLVSLAEG